MKESEKLSNLGYQMLKAQGWPEDAIKTLSDLLVGAGYHRCLEDQQEIQERNEAIIQRAIVH